MFALVLRRVWLSAKFWVGLRSFYRRMGFVHIEAFERYIWFPLYSFFHGKFGPFSCCEVTPKAEFPYYRDRQGQRLPGRVL